MFLGILDPDPQLFCTDPGSFNKQVELILNGFLSLKTDVNVPTESNEQKIKKQTYFLLASWKSLH
jgi:hypothetical protein